MRAAAELQARATAEAQAEDMLVEAAEVQARASEIHAQAIDMQAQAAEILSRVSSSSHSTAMPRGCVVVWVCGCVGVWCLGNERVCLWNVCVCLKE